MFVDWCISPAQCIWYMPIESLTSSAPCEQWSALPITNIDNENQTILKPCLVDALQSVLMSSPANQNLLCVSRSMVPIQVKDHHAQSI